MRSNDMVRIYGTKNMPYTEEYSEGLKEYQTVSKTTPVTLLQKLEKELEEAKKQNTDKVAALEKEISDLKKEAEELKNQTVKTVITTAKKKYTVKKGKKVTIGVSITNTNGKSVTFRSKNKKIASVTKKGVVKGKKKGKTTITISCNGVSKKVNVTVK